MFHENQRSKYKEGCFCILNCYNRKYIFVQKFVLNPYLRVCHFWNLCKIIFTQSSPQPHLTTHLYQFHLNSVTTSTQSPPHLNFHLTSISTCPQSPPNLYFHLLQISNSPRSLPILNLHLTYLHLRTTSISASPKYLPHLSLHLYPQFPPNLNLHLPPFSA